MGDQPDISIIVPVYNTQDYLRRCLDSLAEQTHANIEVVCVDDGSQDGSGEILDEYAAKDRRFTVIHQQNAGASSARNTGMSHARGTYLLFVDSDDFIARDACEILFGLARQDDAQIVVFGGKTFPTLGWADISFASRRATYRKDGLLALIGEPGSYPLMCNKLYLRQFLEENGFTFNTELVLGEDNAFQCVVFPEADTISYCPDKLYYYCIRKDGAVSSANEDRISKAWEHLTTASYITEKWKENGVIAQNESLTFAWMTLFLYGETSQLFLNERERISPSLTKLLDEAFPRVRSGEVRVAAPEAFRYSYMSRAQQVAKEQPFFSLVLEPASPEALSEGVEWGLEFQTEQGYEILVPYDAQAAETPFLRSARELASKDARVRLVPSRDPRRVLDEAAGEYVLHLYSNETLAPYALEELLRIVEDEAKKTGEYRDLVCFGGTMRNLDFNDLYEFFLPAAGAGIPLEPCFPAGFFTGGELFEARSFSLGDKLWSKAFLQEKALACDPLSWEQLSASCLASAPSVRFVPETFLLEYGIWFADDADAQAFAREYLAGITGIPAALGRGGAAEEVVEAARRVLPSFLARALDYVQGSAAYAACFECARSAASEAGLSADGLSDDRRDEVALLKSAPAYDELMSRRHAALQDVRPTEAVSAYYEKSALKRASDAHVDAEAALRGENDVLRRRVDELERSRALRYGRKAMALPHAVLEWRNRKADERRRASELSRALNGPGDAPAVSVVVPVYNAERFLCECLDSILAQTMRNIEIICVNDGSTDGSPAILDKYAARDGRIRVISKENGGYGHTMNTGFAAARGEYIGIVESDDFASPDMFEQLYRFAKGNDCDLVKANYYEHSAAGDVKMEPFAGFDYNTVFDPWVYQGPLTALPVIWSALYRRSMLEANGVRFNETPGASYQDTSFVHQVWMSARRAAIIPGAYLHYRVDNSGSSVKSSAKVFAVCDEYRASELFMCKDAGREQAFSKIMCLLKRGTYWWNFNRIAEEHRRAFALQMRREYLAARRRGWLDSQTFTPEGWKQISLLMDDFDVFMDTYEKGNLDPV